MVRHPGAATVRSLCAALGAVVALAGRPALGWAPFEAVHLAQPVLGAARGATDDGWRVGRLCNVTEPPFGAVGDGVTDDTAALQKAVDACGDLPGGGTVLLPSGGVFLSGSLWLRSNLTFRVEVNATLLGSTKWEAYPMTYTRSLCTMMQAHASLLNAGRCVELKSPAVGWDDCARWATVANLDISGGGTVDGNGDQWSQRCNPTCPDGTDASQRPTMLGLLWVNGLSVRDLRLRRPGAWTVHPAFSNNVRVTSVDVDTDTPGSDGLDPDSCWNVLIANSTFATRDDCVALKSGRDWSGRMVNVSTENVLIERNVFARGHGVAIGSETSGWIRDVVVRDNVLQGVEALIRVKTQRGRGGGVERVLYERDKGAVQQALQVNMVYKKAKPTNASATPVVRDVAVRDVRVNTNESAVLCAGLPESPVLNLTTGNLTVTGSAGQSCSFCFGAQQSTTPKLCVEPPPPPAAAP